MLLISQVCDVLGILNSSEGLNLTGLNCSAIQIVGVVNNCIGILLLKSWECSVEMRRALRKVGKDAIRGCGVLLFSVL